MCIQSYSIVEGYFNFRQVLFDGNKSIFKVRSTTELAAVAAAFAGSGAGSRPSLSAKTRTGVLSSMLHGGKYEADRDGGVTGQEWAWAVPSGR